MDDTPLIELVDVTKEYHGAQALQNVSWSLRKGEIHSIVGENGAGKSTLMKIIAGVTQPSAGKLLLEGRETHFSGPGAALDAGIAMVFQETNLVPSMTVGQNLFLGEERSFNRLRQVYIKAQQLLQSLNFDVDPWVQVSTLGSAKKQMVEIARAVLKNAKLIIFDEPTATLTPEEKGHFFTLIKRLRQNGVTLVFISHALEESLELSDRITVLRDGRLVASDETGNFTRDSIIRAMVGRELSQELYQSRPEPRSPGVPILSVQNISMGQTVRNTSFSIFSGQITGFFGLIGAGRTETAKIIAGALKRNFFHGGEIRLLGRPVRYRIPRPAMLDGIVYVSEDRKVEGFFDQMSISQNIYINHLVAGLEKGAIVSLEKMRALQKEWSDQLKIKALSGDSKVIELSGGNQQKVVIAGALVKKPKLVIFDEPTRGVDVGAIADIHKMIRDLADMGIGVIVISSYLPEIMNLSDRILVYRSGRVVEEFTASEATEDGIMFAAVH